MGPVLFSKDPLPRHKHHSRSCAVPRTAFRFRRQLYNTVQAAPRMPPSHMQHSGSYSRLSSSTRSVVSRKSHALDALRVRFTKVIVPTKQSADQRVLYVVQITTLSVRSNSLSSLSSSSSDLESSSLQQSPQRTWEIVRAYHEFYALKEKLLETLDFGHLCDANCPFLYQHIDHTFPKKRLFGHKRAWVVETRRKQMQLFFTSLLQAFRINNNKHHPCECPTAREKLPQVLAEFLFVETMTKDFANGPSSPTISFTSSESLSDNELCWLIPDQIHPKSEETVVFASLSEDCWICGYVLHDADHRMNTSTTLACGHRFHDECIVVRLNESLACPICKKPCQV